jgi:DNA-binding phage protein
MTSPEKPLATVPWDPVDRLGTSDARAAYLDAARELGDPELIAAAQADIALSLQRDADEQLRHLRKVRGRLPAEDRLTRDASNLRTD